uniref:Uncharacterized protein n=1 Tax=Avena sativa TaxID=4498 RepID=A0ACD5TB31_AVESA
MTDEGGDEMSLRRSSSTSTAAGPLDDEDLLAEILIRLPPLPSSLPRASLVCKDWRRLATDASFLRLFHARHRKPPILGVFTKDDEAGEIVFASVLDPPDRIPTERFSLRVGVVDASDAWSVLGSRHGIVLIINWMLLQLVVYHPVSGDRRTMAVPSEFADSGHLVHNGAVLCAASDGPDHVHGDCPFKLVLVGSSSHGTRHPAVAAFDLDKHNLAVIDRPPVAPVPSNSWIIRGEDGCVGLALLSYPDFEMWDRKISHHGSATWVLRKTASMNGMLGPESASAHIWAYDEDTDAIFMTMDRDPYGNILIIVELESVTVKECRGCSLKDISLPFANFYTAGTHT